MKNRKTLAQLKLTGARGMWFEIKNLNHMDTNNPILIDLLIIKIMFLHVQETDIFKNKRSKYKEINYH
jgi:hypothetical protein